MSIIRRDFWPSTGVEAILDGNLAVVDGDRLTSLQPVLEEFTRQRKWTDGQDRRFADQLVARIPALVELGPAWQGQLVHLVNDLRLTVDHDRAAAAVKMASKSGLVAKVFALLDEGQREVVRAGGGSWKLAALEQEQRLLALDFIDRCVVFDKALWGAGDEVDAWLVGHEQTDRQASSRQDPVLIAAFGRWLVELARWTSR